MHDLRFMVKCLLHVKYYWCALLFGVRGIVVTMDEYSRVFWDGVVVVDSDSGIIVDVGDLGLVRDYGVEVVYGDSRSIVMPGLINTHTHSPMSIFRGFVSGVSGFDWLRRVWDIEAQLKPRHVYVGALLSIISMIRSGTTAFADHYFYAEEIAKAVVETGVRAVLAKTVIDLHEGPPKHSLKESLSFAKKYFNFSDSLSTMIGVHSLYSCSIETLREAVSVSMDTGIPIHMHLSESRDEVRFVKESYGVTPIKFADDLGILGAKHLLAHVSYVMDEYELNLLGRVKARIAYAPFTKMRGGQAIAPIMDLMVRGASISLATDGPLSCGDLDMFREMKFMLAAQNLKYGSASALKPIDVIKASTVNAAMNLGFNNLGFIGKGAKADLIVLNAWKSKVIPIKDVYYTILYCLNGGDVDTVIINGKPIMVNGVIRVVDEEKIIEEAVKVAGELEDLTIKPQ
jgi:5-methylthioadenosine/S-adenosylhomocysteine deaminase